MTTGNLPGGSLRKDLDYYESANISPGRSSATPNERN